MVVSQRRTGGNGAPHRGNRPLLSDDPARSRTARSIGSARPCADRELRIYTRPESGGLIVGIYDAEPDLYDMRKLPVDFDMSRMKAARDSIQVAQLIEAAQPTLPVDRRAHADDHHDRAS